MLKFSSGQHPPNSIKINFTELLLLDKRASIGLQCVDCCLNNTESVLPLYI